MDNCNIDNHHAAISYDQSSNTLYLSGPWKFETIDEQKLQSSIASIPPGKLTIDGRNVNKLDTIGAYFIHKLWLTLKTNQISCIAPIFSDTEAKFFARIGEALSNLHEAQEPPRTNNLHSLLHQLGNFVCIQWQNFIVAIMFLGQFCVTCASISKNWSRIDYNEISRTILNTGLKGVWVAITLNFLIGVTLAYEMSPQFINYGANVYIVNFLGIALLKEISPLLTAVIVAGRTGSAITAELGTMKIQEEIDALQTMGIAPIERLVFPKVVGVGIALPLITAIGDAVSMLGGAIVANSYLGVTYTLFIERMQAYVSIYNYTDGIIKSVAFALSIGLVSCFCGLQVKGNANSIGSNTTKSVVISIVLVIFFDALFAVIFKILSI